MKIRILERAEQDLVAGYFFYESQGQGLGDYFLDSLYSDIDALQLHAGIHPWDFGFQRALSKRFPYAIYYRVAGEQVQIWAVLDCRQHPDKLRKKLA